ncbi:hypothetical protein ACG1BZ_00815 [Microbulbifer sp. CNSA002]|uniref:hypothetical protein n=1 Tax=Microbulbifer sp. CNSA002 TaxID=3373604 RepID=UPI0039B5F3AF
MSDYKFLQTEKDRINEIRSKMKKHAEEVKKKSKGTTIEEPLGKQTNPTEIDHMRDQKNDN